MRRYASKKPREGPSVEINNNPCQCLLVIGIGRNCYILIHHYYLIKRGPSFRVIYCRSTLDNFNIQLKMAPTLNTSSSILLIGAGTWGCSTALHLARRGYKNVTVLDPHPVPSPIAAGNDINKIMEHFELKSTLA